MYIKNHKFCSHSTENRCSGAPNVVQTSSRRSIISIFFLFYSDPPVVPPEVSEIHTKIPAVPAGALSTCIFSGNFSRSSFKNTFRNFPSDSLEDSEISPEIISTNLNRNLFTNLL